MLAAWTACARAEPQPLNVLLVTLDTTRADHIGCYAGDASRTPHFDEVAREGTRFALAISTSALTPVSHASILTGLNNMRHRLRVLHAESGFRLPSDVPSLARVLKQRGYRTSAFHSAFPVSAHFGLDQGFDVFQSFDASLQQGPANTWWDIAKHQRRSDQTTDMAIAHLREEREPFFTWIHYWDPHDGKLVPPEEFWPERDRVGQAASPAAREAEARALYAAEVRYVDHEFGRLVAELRRQGRWERTLVVIVADHGEGLGDHGWQGHRVLYQEQVNVPLIVRVPGAAQAPLVSDLVRTIDIFPTVLDYLGVTPPAPVDGATLRGLIDGRRERARTAYADQINAFDLNAQKQVQDRPLDAFLFCAMDAQWKLVYRPHDPARSELFELRADPQESRNVYAERPDEVERLLCELALQRGWVTAPFERTLEASAAASRPVDVQAALSSLGYAGDEDGAHHAPEWQWKWVCPRHPEISERSATVCGVCGLALIPAAADS